MKRSHRPGAQMLVVLMLAASLGARCGEAGSSRQRVIVQFRSGLVVSTERGAFEISEQSPGASGRSASQLAEQSESLNGILAGGPVAAVDPLFRYLAEESDAAGTPEDPDPKLFFAISPSSRASDAEVDAFVAELKAHPLLEAAYVEPIPEPAVAEPR